MMRRREFFKMLAGLPFLGFLKVRTEEEQDINDVRIYRYALSPEEVKMVYETSSTTVESNCVTWIGSAVFYKDRLEA